MPDPRETCGTCDVAEDKMNIGCSECFSAFDAYLHERGYRWAPHVMDDWNRERCAKALSGMSSSGLAEAADALEAMRARTGGAGVPDAE